MALAVVVLTLPESGPTLAPEAMAALPATGLGNPVTGVLMAYRGFDTLLEKVVLVLALIGVWSLASDRCWGGRPGLEHRLPADGVLPFFARTLPPIGVLLGVHLMWTGADDPGGAFQGGTVLAAMWLLVMMAGVRDAPAIREQWLRVGAGVGPGRVPRGRTRRRAHRRGLPRLPGRDREAADPAHRSADAAHDRAGARAAGRRSAGARGGRAMSTVTLFGLCGAALVGLGLYGAARAPAAAAQDDRVQPARQRRVPDVRRDRAARRGRRLGGDPVPQALVITGIVVAFAATALAVALLLRLFEESGEATLDAAGSRGRATGRRES